jgi:hypothetical protein
MVEVDAMGIASRYAAQPATTADGHLLKGICPRHGDPRAGVGRPVS